MERRRSEVGRENGVAKRRWWSFCAFRRCSRLFVSRSKVETPIHGGIREFVTWKCKEHGVKIMDVLANPKRKCWVLESEFLEASAILHKILKQG